jgi:hypothetical protein
MADKPWKAFERKVAAELGTCRALNHLSGGGDKSDIEHPIFSVDCKLKKTFSLSDFRELRENARKHHKIPVLVYRKPKERLTYAVVELSTFTSLAKGAGWLTTDDEDAAEGASIESVV